MKKYLILIALLATPLLVSADGAEVCTNSNILAYYTPETMSAQDRIVFYLPSFVRLSSLEASFNGQTYPVQYKTFGFITRAKVLIPENLQGSIRSELGAQSSSGCNKPLSFTFNR